MADSDRVRIVAVPTVRDGSGEVRAATLEDMVAALRQPCPCRDNNPEEWEQCMSDSTNHVMRALAEAKNHHQLCITGMRDLMIRVLMLAGPCCGPPDWVRRCADDIDLIHMPAREGMN